MKNRSIKTAVGMGLLMLPMMAALADAPIVQGHNIQPGTANSVATNSSVATPVDASATTQAPNQALVTGIDADPSAVTSNNPLDIGNQITTLQQEVQDLRGQLEVQGHTISQLQSQLNQLTGTTTKTPVAATMQATTAPAAPAGNTVQTVSPVTPVQPTATVTPAAPATVATPSSANGKSEAQLYQQAYDLMAAKQYTQATVGLQTYLQQYPTGQYAANAHYWLGELGLIAGNTQQAQSQFNIVIAQFGQSPKAADSMLKLGMIYYEQANWKAAKVQFNTIVQQYPNTTTAQMAQQQLQQIQQSGN